VDFLDRSLLDRALSAIFANPFRKEEGVLRGIGYPSDLPSDVEEKFTEYSLYFNKELFTRLGSFIFVLKEGVLPSKALEAILEGPTVADCLLTSHMVMHKLIYDLIGEEKFNAIFQHREYLFSQQLNGLEMPTLGKYNLVRYMSESELQIGDHCYFQGVPLYYEKHPERDWGGLGVIYCGTVNDKRLFQGLGLNSPQPEQEILRLLIEAYNAPSDNGTIHQVPPDPVDVKLLFPTFGFDPTKIFRLNADLIGKIQKTPVDMLLPEGDSLCQGPYQGTLHALGGPCQFGEYVDALGGQQPGGQYAISESLLLYSPLNSLITATPVLDRSLLDRALSAIFANPFREEEGVLRGIGYSSDLPSDVEEKLTKYPSYFNKECFTQEGSFTFQLKKGILPSKALEAILEGPTVADCILTSHMVMHKLIYDLIGEEKFNAIFQHRRYVFDHQLFDSRNGLEIPTLSQYNLVQCMPESELQIGDCCYFEGVPRYSEKHPQRDWGGLSVIYCGTVNGERLFQGLGLSSPQPEREILRLLIEAYNAPSDNGTTHQVPSDPVAVKQQFPKFGFDPTKIFRLNADLIDKIQKTPVDRLLPQGVTIINKEESA
jgi:hypothetical protein